MIKKLWSNYLGKDSVQVIPNYVWLFQPTKPGSVQIRAENGSVLFTSSLKETSYIEEEKLPHVPPYNAYSASVKVEVSP